MRSRCCISIRQRLGQIPVLINRPAMLHNRSQRVLQPYSVVCLFPDRYVSNQAEHSTAPVRSSPAMRVIQPLIAGLRLALVHIAHHVVPHAARGQLARHHTRQRLHIGRQPLLHPVLFVWFCCVFFVLFFLCCCFVVSLFLFC